MKNHQDRTTIIKGFLGSDCTDELAYAILDKLDSVGVDPRTRGGVPSDLWSAVVAVARGTQTWREDALVAVIAQAGGLDACTMEWARGVVQHAENGDKPEALTPGELDASIDDLYNDLLWERKELLDDARKCNPAANDELLEGAFVEWAGTPINERGGLPVSVPAVVAEQVDAIVEELGVPAPVALEALETVIGSYYLYGHAIASAVRDGEIVGMRDGARAYVVANLGNRNDGVEITGGKVRYLSEAEADDVSDRAVVVC